MSARVSLAAAVLFAGFAAWAGPLVLEGEVPEDGPDFFLVPFQVPPGTEELEVRHDDLSSANILDWGLEDPNGFRGWGGGNPEPAVVARTAASRSYLAGPLPPGTWQVVVGKAQVKEKPARYRIEIDLRTEQTLAPQPERRPYVPAAPLRKGQRWYAGDFHLHSKESGDARPTLDEIATFARGRGLDFVALSEHNTTSELDFIDDAQARHPDLLLVPSVEYTTYHGHANGFGATRHVDFKLGLNGMTLGRAIADFQQQGAVFTLNHPVLDIGSACIGCAWEFPVSPGDFGAVEIGVGGWDTTGAIFDEAAIAFWDRLADEGIHLTAVGGSDDHRAGVNLNQTQSPIGDPTTLVLADELSVSGLIDGLRAGRTVVKLRGPGDPLVTVDLDGARHGDTVVAASSTLRAEVTGGVGTRLRLVHDGVPGEVFVVDADPFTVERTVEAPEQGETRWRAEVLVGGKPRVVTSNVWLARTWPVQGGTPTIHQRPLPQTCSSAGGPFSGALLVLMALLRSRGQSRPG